MQYTEANLHRCASSSFAESSLSSTEVHGTSVLRFFLLSALKECLFKVSYSLWMNLSPYSKITNLCLDFLASADVILYPMRGLVEIARRRDYLACIIHSKLALPSSFPVLHVISLLFPFSIFLHF